jgi:hypothetical protein
MHLTRDLPVNKTGVSGRLLLQEIVFLAKTGLTYVNNHWDELCALHKELGLGSKPRSYPGDKEYDLHINVVEGNVRIDVLTTSHAL